jgi:hypothetical protein
MAVQHTNRRGQTYYLHQRRTRAGKLNYYFSLDTQGDLPDAIPAGYEVYEHPHGQVFLRKARAQVVAPDEIAQIEREIARYPRLEHSRVDVKGHIITVYVPNQQAERSLAGLLRNLARGRDVDVEGIVARGRRLSPEFRLLLVDEERRLYQPQRFCYLGSIDDWIDIGESGRLSDLLESYLKYLGTESWFDLC